MPRIYDISLPIADGGMVYPGNPAIRITAQQSISAGNRANVSAVSFGSHTGTHVDAPRHFIEDGVPIDEVPLDRFIGPALLVAFPDDVTAVGEEHLRAHDLGGHTRVLLKTRNSALLGRRDFAPDYTYLAPDGAAHLVERGVQLVGIDYHSIEQFRSGHHRTHLTLLRRNVVIVEGLNLMVPAPGVYDFICLPLRLTGLDGSPARAVLIGP
jgi:arylformamidase